LGEKYIYGRKGHTDVALSEGRSNESWTVLGLTAPFREVPVIYKVIAGASNSFEYLRFFMTQVKPIIPEETVVVVDNLNYHTTGTTAESVRNVLREAGCSYLTLPTHSPEFNPIEFFWSWLKAELLHQRWDTPVVIGVNNVISKLETHQVIGFYHQAGWV